jgi:hypothetical protein
VLAADVSRLLDRVARVRGVRRVDNHLTVYDDPRGAPGLPGALAPRRGAWGSPTARLLASAVGTGVMMSALAWRRIASPGSLAQALRTLRGPTGARRARHPRGRRAGARGPTEFRPAPG